MTLFDAHLDVIRIAADGIAGETDLYSKLRSNSLISGKYDLERSARLLREAADKLERIANRSKDHAVQEG